MTEIWSYIDENSYICLLNKYAHDVGAQFLLAPSYEVVYLVVGGEKVKGACSWTLLMLHGHHIQASQGHHGVLG